MFKEMKNLMMLYLREKGVRDLMLIAIYAIFVVVYYLLYNKSGIMAVRENIIWSWIVAIALYTLMSAFGGYGNIRKSYCRLLLPVPIHVKFITEWLRTFVLFGGVLLGVIFAIDLFFEYVTYQSFTRRFAHHLSLKEMFFIANEPLNYLPIMVYLALLFHSVAFLISTKINIVTGLLLVVATFADRKSVV